MTDNLNELHSAQRDLQQMLRCEQALDDSLRQGEQEALLIAERLNELKLTRAYFKAMVDQQRAKVAALQTEAGIAPVAQ